MSRSKRVINAFINCVKTGQYTLDYAILLIEDNQKYGFLTEEDKAVFYETFFKEEVTEETEDVEVSDSGSDTE